MNENINLCEILKGLEGIKLWSPLFGSVILEEILENKIAINTNVNFRHDFDRCGKYYGDRYKDTECLIFPSKEQRNWKYFVRPIPFEAPVMCRNKNISWFLAPYAGKLRNGRHYVKHKEFGKVFDDDYDYIIPFDKFDPNNIEESLKYNIQK